MPFETGCIEKEVDVRDIEISGSYAYLACNLGLRVIDVSLPSNPHEVGNIEMRDCFRFFEGSHKSIISNH